MEEYKREDEIHVERKAGDVGAKGGSADAAAMRASDIPGTAALAVPIGRVRWGATWAGFVVAIATTLLLAALGVGIGLTLDRTGVGGPLAYWMLGSVIIAVFLGSYLVSRFGNVRDAWTGVLHGVVLWSLIMLLNVALGGIARGVAGFAGISTVSPPMEGMRTSLTSEAGLWFFTGSLILLIVAAIGGALGAGSEEHEARGVERPNR